MTSTVVVAAHNEESVIGSTLSALLEHADAEEFDVVVVCNGCSDETAEVARRAGADVRVFELGTASKTAALRLGDGEARPGPRIYLDADVVLDTDAARELVDALSRPGVLAAAPTLTLDTSRSSWLVRSYSRIWTLLPSIRDGLAGRGAYAISAEGRTRFDEFPDVISDDLFIDQLFTSSERAIVSAESTVVGPRTVRALIHRKARVFMGNQQLAARSDLPMRQRSGSNLAWLGVIRRNPLRLLDAPAYVAVTICSKLRAARWTRSGVTTWARDDTSR